MFFQSGSIAYGDDSSRSQPEALLNKYGKIKKDLKHSGSVPFYGESSVNKHASQVDINVIIKYPFDVVQKELLVPTNWCQIILTHPDVKVCTYRKVNNIWLLNVYHADKFSEPLDDAYQMKFVYRVSKLQPAYFDIALAAHEDPSHTKNHQLGLEVLPLKNYLSFIHLRYSFGYSAFGYFLMKIFGGTRGRIRPFSAFLFRTSEARELQ